MHSAGALQKCLTTIDSHKELETLLASCRMAKIEIDMFPDCWRALVNSSNPNSLNPGGSTARAKRVQLILQHCQATSIEVSKKSLLQLALSTVGDHRDNCNVVIRDSRFAIRCDADQQRFEESTASIVDLCCSHAKFSTKETLSLFSGAMGDFQQRAAVHLLDKSGVTKEAARKALESTCFVHQLCKTVEENANQVPPQALRTLVWVLTEVPSLAWQQNSAGALAIDSLLGESSKWKGRSYLKACEIITIIEPIVSTIKTSKAYPIDQETQLTTLNFAASFVESACGQSGLGALAILRLLTASGFSWATDESVLCSFLLAHRPDVKDLKRVCDLSSVKLETMSQQAQSALLAAAIGAGQYRGSVTRSVKDHEVAYLKLLFKLGVKHVGSGSASSDAPSALALAFDYKPASAVVLAKVLLDHTDISSTHKQKVLKKALHDINESTRKPRRRRYYNNGNDKTDQEDQEAVSALLDLLREHTSARTV